MSRLLLVDDDTDHLQLVSHQLRAAGHETVACEDPEQAETLLLNQPFDLVLTDLEMPGRTGLDVLRTAKQQDPAIEVLILTGRGGGQTAIEALQLGAFDYLEKPFPSRELLVVVEKGLEQRAIKLENQRLRMERREKYHFRNLIGSSPPMQEVFRLVERVAPTDATVLILGESGTGKELIARALHENSRRSHHRFLKINCTALTETLLESELFGHEKGSFTGAHSTRRGLFEVAHGGTLLLDEIGDTSLALQAKLLRVLQEGEIRRVGGTDDIAVDVRVLTATNRDLKQRITENCFREDLYFRLNVVTVQLPPLRERREDIKLLVQHLLEKRSPDPNAPLTISKSAMQILTDYDWPGNVRELENVLERALVLCDGHQLRPADLPREIMPAVLVDQTAEAPPDGHTVPSAQPTTRLLSLSELEKRHIAEVLRAVGGHRVQAAETLGITRRTLYDKIKRYGLEEF